MSYVLLSYSALNFPIHTLRLLRSLSLWLFNSHCTISQLTNTPWASIPLSFLSPTTHVFCEGPWPGSRRPFLWNYSLEGLTTHWWTRRRLGSRDIVYGLTDILGFLSTILHSFSQQNVSPSGITCLTKHTSTTFSCTVTSDNLQSELLRIGNHRSYITSLTFVNEVSSSQIMLTTSKVNSIRRKRDKLFESTLKVLREGIDKYEQSNMQEIGYLKSYEAQLEDGWRRFQLFQNELYELDEDDIAQEPEAFKT